MWLRHCLSCEKRQRFYWCKSCWQNIRSYESPHWSQQLQGGLPCISYTPYQETRQLLYLVKYHGFSELARESGEHLGRWFLKHWPLPDCIIPIPLSQERFQERGFNQSLELARGLSQIIRRPVLEALVRAVDTPRLYNQTAEERQRIMEGNNGQNVFALSPAVQKSPAFLCQKTYLLLDDVLTTGSTMNAAFEALSKISNKGVGLTFARADITDPLDFRSV